MNAIDLIIDSLDGKQLKNVRQVRKQMFAEAVLCKLSSLQCRLDNSAAASIYRDTLIDNASKARDALIKFKETRYGRSNKCDVMVATNTLLGNKPSKLALNGIINSLTPIAALSKSSGKSIPSTYLSRRIANWVAKRYRDDFGLKPTHTSSFNTKAYRDECGYPNGKGDKAMAPYDAIMAAISVIEKIEFSDPVLRAATRPQEPQGKKLKK